MMTIYLAPLTALAGGLTYCFSRHPKLVELGRIAFAMGLLATLLTLASGKALHF
jgi:Na+/phosphate symporter